MLFNILQTAVYPVSLQNEPRIALSVGINLQTTQWLLQLSAVVVKSSMFGLWAFRITDVGFDGEFLFRHKSHEFNCKKSWCNADTTDGSSWMGLKRNSNNQTAIRTENPALQDNQINQIGFYF